MTPGAPTSRNHVVGRVDELSRIDAFLDDIVEGPAALLLEGGSGMGKTTLWDRAVAAAEGRGCRVSSIRPAESEATLAFGGLADLFEGTGDLFERLPAPQRDALEVALLRADPVGPPPDPRAVYAAALTVLREVGTQGQVLIAIDDVQWLDGSTAAALAFALRRLTDEPIGWLLAVRGSASTLPLGIGRALPEERIELLSIEPLSVDEIAELVRARLGTSFPPAIVHGMHETSGGNPFFALEIARATLRGDTRATGQALPIPRNLRDDLVRDRVGALPSLARELLLYASACARPTVELLEAALEPSPVDAPLADAVDAGIVERDGGSIAFAHPIYRSAIYAESSREHRHRVHRRLSEVVDDGEERARHLALAADGPDEAAASALEDAAGRARARGSTAGAAELCELAERLTPSDRVADIRRLRGAAAEYRMLSGDYATAFSLLESVVSIAPPGPDLAEALLRLGRALVIRDDERRSVDVLTQALAEDAIPADVRSSLHMWRSTALSSLGDLPAALHDAEEALRLARSADDPDALADALTALIAAQVWLGQGVDRTLATQAIELEASTEPRSVARRPSISLADLLAKTGEIEESRSTCTSLLDEAVGSGDDDAAGRLHAELGWIEFLAGDWVASLEHLRKSVVLSPVQGSRLGALALVEAHRGEADAATSHAMEAMEAHTRSGAVDAEILALSALGALELSLGNASGARDQLERAWQVHRLAGFGEPAMFPFVADHAMALIELGANDEAGEVVAWLEERGRALQRPWAIAVAARCRAMLAANDGDLRAAFEALTVALEAHERVQMPFERGRTLMVQGSIRRRDRQKKSARASLDEAISIFERLGARSWIALAHAERARIGGRRRVTELTAVETRVAKLAAAGRTNREIAATLFMSVRTVEGHLSHIYAKLGLRSRTELSLFFDPREDEPDAPEDEEPRPTDEESSEP
jgi:DNA-binding CsgD family transcriptional regulator